jgi:hypothetical protein
VIAQSITEILKKQKKRRMLTIKNSTKSLSKKRNEPNYQKLEKSET